MSYKYKKVQRFKGTEVLSFFHIFTKKLSNLESQNLSPPQK